MADVEAQLQQYASWLADRADEHPAASPHVSAASRAAGARITAETPGTGGEVVVQRDDEPRRPRRVLAGLSAAAAAVALIVVLAVVARPDSAQAPASSTVPIETVAPAPATTAPATTASAVPTTTIVVPAGVVTAEPETAAPGETIELRFSERAPRGAPWYMSPVDASGVGEPLYLLIAAFEGYDCIDCPTWYGPGDEWAWEDIGREGPGPDTVVIPEVAAPGVYELCTANAPAPYCVRVTVAGAAVTTTTVVDDVDVSTSPFEIPAGNLSASPADLFVMHADGDLYVHRGALAGGGAEERLVDMADPRAPVSEGPGPNVVDDVAGIIAGSLVYADCCEPVAGNVIAIPDAGAEPVFVGYGYGTTLDPAGTHLAGGNDMSVWVADLGTRTATHRTLNVDPSAPYVTVVGVTWTADGERIVVIGLDERGYVAMPFRNDASLTPLPTTRLDLPSGPGALTAQLAGLGPSGEIVVAVTPTDTTELRFLDPVTFEEDASLRRPLANQPTSVLLAPDGESLLWVVDDVVWYEPAGEAARVVASGATAAWFVRVV